MTTQDLVLFVSAHAEVACLVVAFIAGSAWVLVLATLAGQDLIPFHTVFVFCAIGNYLSDALWYLAGRTGKRHRAFQWGPVERGLARTEAFMRAHHNKDFALFIVVKFVYGIRVLMIVLLGLNAYPLKRFLVFNFSAVAIINFVVVGAGWMMGRGISIYVDVFTNLATLLTFIFAVYLLATLCRYIISRVSTRSSDDNGRAE
jgi:membrane protein DedA with SNARE-associated domain